MMMMDDDDQDSIMITTMLHVAQYRGTTALGPLSTEKKFFQDA